MNTAASLSEAHERPLLRLFAALQFSHLLDYMILLPLGAELMRAFGIDAGQFGLLVGAYTLASAAAGLFGGGLLDRFDRRSVLLTLYAGFIVATLGCALAPSYGLLLAARALAGACAGLMSATLMTLVAELVAPPRRGRAMGTIMSAFGACAVVGVPLGLLLASRGGWRLPFAGVALLASLVWLLLWRQLPSARAAGASRTPLADILRTPGLAPGWLLTFGIVFAGFLIVPYLGAFLGGNLGLGLRELSLLYLVAGAATFFSARWIGRAADRWGPVRVLALLMLGTLLPHLWFTHLQPGPLALTALVFVLFMVLTSSRAIPAAAWLAGRAPPPLRGRFMSINMAATEAASGLAAWTAGLIVSGDPQQAALQNFDRVGWLAAAVTLATLALLAWLNARPRVVAGDVAAGH